MILNCIQFYLNMYYVYIHTMLPSISSYHYSYHYKPNIYIMTTYWYPYNYKLYNIQPIIWYKLSYLYYLHYNTNYVSQQSYLLFYPIYNTIYISLQSQILSIKQAKCQNLSTHSNGFETLHIDNRNMKTQVPLVTSPRRFNRGADQYPVWKFPPKMMKLQPNQRNDSKIGRLSKELSIR